MKAKDIFTSLSDYKPNILGYEHYNKFSLLLPLVDVNDETHLLFEVRSHAMRSQPGDVCFPGGRVDLSDRTELHSALRETEEEIGINEKYIKNIIPLDYMVNGFHGIIYPFVGKVTSLDNMSLNKQEVAEVFTVPLKYFLENEPEKYKISFEVVPEEDFPFHLIQGGEDYKWRMRQLDELFYEYNDRIIWGLTARIIHHFVEVLKNRSINSR